MKNISTKDIKWIAIHEIGVEGRGWVNTNHPFDRLPTCAQKDVAKDLWALGEHSAGLSCRFDTDSANILVRWSLRHPLRTTPQMSRISETGFDLYVQRDNKWDMIGSCGAMNTRPEPQILVVDLQPGQRRFLMYFPLYNGPDEAWIGIDSDAYLKPVAPREPDVYPPLVFYGTSITQGAFAARPGMAYPSILSRRLNRPIINLGFAGMGKMHLAIVRLLCELNAAAFVLDPVPNLEANEVYDRALAFIGVLRKAHSQTPIIMMESVSRSLSGYHSQWHDRVVLGNAEFRRAYNKLSARDRNLFYVESSRLVSEDGQMTVDGTHPTDWGFVQIAGALEPLLKRIICTLPVKAFA